MDPFDEDVIESEHTSVTGGSAPAEGSPETDGPPEQPTPALEPQPIAAQMAHPDAKVVDYRNPDTPAPSDIPAEPTLAVKLGAWLILTVVCTIGLASIATMGWLIYRGVRWAYFQQ